MQVLHSWGLNKTHRKPEQYNAERYIFVERVREHLDLRVAHTQGDGQPIQFALTEQNQHGDPEAAEKRVTPYFSTIEALDYFCQLNLQQFLALQPQRNLPRRLFWDQPTTPTRSGFATRSTETGDSTFRVLSSE